MPVLSIVFWNIWVGHKAAHVRSQILEIRRLRNPEVIGLMEAAHMYGHLEGLGYRVFQVRRKSRRGYVSEAANSAILVRDDVKVVRRWFLILKLVWKGPKLGKKHDPRWFPVVLVKHARRVWKTAPACHLPFGSAQRAEADRGLRRLLKWTVKGRPVVVAGDMQHGKHAMDARVADQVGAWIVGFGIDLAMGRNCDVVKVESLGLRGSDVHPAVLVRVRARR